METGASLDLLLAWSRECLIENEDGEAYKDELFNSFCSWFDQEIAKQEYSSLLGEALQEQRCFKKKIKTTRGKKVAVFSGLLKS